MNETLPFLLLVLTLAGLGAATVRSFLPNGPLFAEDKRQLERVAWMFVGGAVLLLSVIALVSGGA